MRNIVFIIWYKMPKIILILFLPLSFVFFLIILIRKIYLVKLISRYTSKTKLIIIGNLNIGGSGKTPFTIWLTNYLQNKEIKIAVISSGYKSNVSSPIEINSSSKANEVGDEALLLKLNTNAIVVSSDNRVKSTRYLESKNIDFIIHDDGLQHYKLNRHYEFIISKFNDLENNFLLPCGPIREPKSFHPKAIFILSNYYDNKYPGFYTKLTQIRSGKDNQIYSLNDKKFSKSHLLTAIADNRMLKKEFRAYHPNLQSTSFPDHHKFLLSDVPKIKDPILVTEKDFTKLKEFNINNIHILEQSLFPNDKLIKIIENL